MKIAVLSSGFLRGWSLNKSSVLSTLFQGVDPSSIDFFLHTYHQNYFEVSSGKEDVYMTEDEIKSQFVDVNVKTLVIENRDAEFIERNIIAPSLKYSDLPNFLHFHQESSGSSSVSIPLGSRIYDQLRGLDIVRNSLINYVKTTGTKYDYVVKIRYDLFIHTPIEWKLMNPDFTETIYIESGTTGGWPCDCFAIGSYSSMVKVYCNRFQLLDDILGYTKSKLSYTLHMYDPPQMCAHYSIRAVCDLTDTILSSLPVTKCSVRRSDTLFYVPGRGLCDLPTTRQSLGVIDV